VHWLNAPARWSEEAGLLTVTADPGTDFWRTTSYGYVRDSGDGGCNARIFRDQGTGGQERGQLTRPGQAEGPKRK
jgi:hypothetical protein